MPSSSFYDRPREGHDRRYADDFSSRSRRSPSPVDRHSYRDNRDKDRHYYEHERSHRRHERRHEDELGERRSNFRDQSEEGYRSRGSNSRYESSSRYRSPDRKYRLERDRSDKFGIGTDDYDEYRKKDRHKEDREKERLHKHREQNGKSTSRRDSSPIEEDGFERLRRNPNLEEATQKINGHHRRALSKDRDLKEREWRRDSSTRRDEDSRHLDRRKHLDAKYPDLNYPEVEKERVNGSRRIKHESHAERQDHLPEIRPKEASQKTLSLNGRTSHAPPPPPAEERPETPPPPPPPPSSSSSPVVFTAWSFADVKLPHELLEADWPIQVSDGKILRPFRLTYDPDLGGGRKGKTPLKTSQVRSDAIDPRKGSTLKIKAEEDVLNLDWKWDKHSAKEKSSLPRAVVVTQLSPLTTMGQIKQHFRGFGRIDMAELKMDERTGASLGICYIRFCQDYNEDKSLKQPEVEEESAQRGDVIAREVVQKNNGQKVLGETVRVFLDNDKMSRFIRAHTLEMASRYAPKAKEEPRQETSTPIATETSFNLEMKMPPPHAPKGPRAHPSSTLSSMNVPPLRNGVKPHYANPAASPHFSRSPMTPQHGSPSPLVKSSHNGHSSYSRGVEEGWHDWRSPHVTGQLARHDNSNIIHPLQRERSPLHFSMMALPQFVAKLEKPYVFVRSHAKCNLTRGDLVSHLADSNPECIHTTSAGWYFSFEDDGGAKKCAKLDGSFLKGIRLGITVLEPNTSPGKSAPKRPSKTSWTEEDLLADSKLLILRELGESFMQDMKRRVFKTFLDGFIQRDSVGGKAIHSSHEMEEAEATDSDSDEEIAKTVAVKGRRRVIKEEGEERETEDFTLQPVSASEEEEEEENDLDKPIASMQTKVANKKGKSKKASKIVEVVEEESTQEEKIMTKALGPNQTKKAAKIGKEKSPAMDLIAMGLADNEEDLYYMKLALQKMQTGMSTAEIEAEVMAAIEALNDLESSPGVKGLPRNISGCARTESLKKIPPAEKALHLPDRNRAVVDPASAVGLASARDNRADSRRFVQGIEQHKKETATDTDILKFNQLRSRKKQLKFAKSPIHDWGLYAMELIPAGDMVIEYVGEIVRQQVADQREKMYEKQGNFSTYLFRVDDDVVVDATKKGNIARLMNHCCTPNCNAKILTLNGEKRIVLFAKNPILPGQELTYDYKFQATGDEEDAIACLCGSPGCRRFL